MPGENKRLFCLEQSPLDFFRVLFLRENTLLPANYEHSPDRWTTQWLKNEIYRYRAVLRISYHKIKRFLIYKYKIRELESFTELPFFGHICVLVNKGYKVFDFSQGTAVKVYRDDIDMSTIAAELESLKKGNCFDFAPSIRKWNTDERWYEEEYIRGSLDRSDKPRQTASMFDKFYRDVIPCLERLLMHHPPVTKSTLDYVTDIRNTLISGDFWRQGTDGNKINTIMDFIGSMVEKFRSEGNIPVFLVLTHGDFCPANMLNTKKGLKVIDWESAAYRSALFDFYSYFFFRPLHQKHPLGQSISEIKAALPEFLSRVSAIAPDISGSLKSHEKIYRWLFYTERMRILIERVRYDTKLNILDNMLLYINVFNSYEEMTAQSREHLSYSKP